jgi:hypothetical protein
MRNGPEAPLDNMLCDTLRRASSGVILTSGWFVFLACFSKGLESDEGEEAEAESVAELTLFLQERLKRGMML